MENIVGHQKAKTILQDNMHVQSWLLHGMNGIGKASLAKAFANVLLLKHKSDFLTSVVTIGKSKSISVENIRTAQNFLSLSSHGCKIVIIESSETMTQSAANCLLKTLEEPPENTYIILTTSNKSPLPAALVYRCLTVYMHPLSSEETTQVLAKHNIQTDTCINNLCGSPGILLSSYEKILEFYHLLDKNPSLNQLLNFFSDTDITYDAILYVLNRALMQKTEYTHQDLYKLHDQFTKIQKLISDAKKFYLEKEHVLMSLAYITASLYEKQT